MSAARPSRCLGQRPVFSDHVLLRDVAKLLRRRTLPWLRCPAASTARDADADVGLTYAVASLLPGGCAPPSCSNSPGDTQTPADDFSSQQGQAEAGGTGGVAPSSTRSLCHVCAAVAMVFVPSVGSVRAISLSCLLDSTQRTREKCLPSSFSGGLTVVRSSVCMSGRHVQSR